MAEEQKNVEVPETKPETTIAPVEQPAETKPVEEIPKTDETPAVEDKPAEEAAPAEEAKPEEKEDVKPIEEGHLSHKAQGLSFPK